MTLLYITNGINGSGGLERVLSVKASMLAEEYGYEVSILCLNDTDLNPFYEFSPKIKLSSISVNGNPISYFLSYKKGIQKFVNEFQPDVISVCDDGLKGFFLPKIIRTKAKWIYERHASIQLNTDNSLKGRLLKNLMHKQVTKFDRFVVLTPGNIKEWGKENVIAIPNPLSFGSSVENPLSQKRLIAVGSHSFNKGYDLLLEVWSKLEKEFSDWRLDVFGKKDPQETYVKMAQEMNLKNLRFHDPVRDIQKEYEGSSILVLPSRSEGFGMVLIEAMECGVPCVSFDCPSGPGDIISDGEDGYLIPELDTVEMEEKLKKLMKNETLRNAMGKKAKEKAEKYSASEIVQQWDELFNTLKAQ
ncbi:glycosyltransferase family 4 protein [Moheibacter sp.]|uniref:glycosyltransferase family 4 protein n=1 Tax=Moheibacter sp. TaxID=1965316 RepID=UPI003C714B20